MPLARFRHQYQCRDDVSDLYPRAAQNIVMAEQSYVVRIYRRRVRPGRARDAQDATSLIGIVEDAQSGGQRFFHDIEELWSILNDTDAQRNDDSGDWQP